MSINRKENPTLNDYKMVQVKKNLVDYIQKGQDEREDQDHFDIGVLEIFENLKKYY
jgi:hypothetical protein